MSNDQAFDMPLIRGLGQGQDLGGGVGTDSDGNTLVSGGAEGGTDTSQLLGPEGSDPTYSGTTVGSGGTSGGGALGPSSSSTGTSVTSSITSNLPLILGGLAVVAGIAGVAYLANRKHMQDGGAKGASRRRFSRSRSYARRR
jgi:hypothetical protein